jgi:hypothetical protein
MKTILSALILALLSVLPSTSPAADDMRGRDRGSKLDTPVYSTIEGALTVAKQTGRPIFAFVYSPSNTKGLDSNERVLGFYTDKEEVRAEIKKNFVQAFLNASSPATKKHIANTEKIKHPVIVIMDKDGKELAREDVESIHAALKQVQKFVALPK